MPSKLLVTSKSCLKMLEENDKFLPLCQFDKVQLIKTPLDYIPKVFDGDVFALGGGSVIDAGKLIAGTRQCWAIPTTASGAGCTSHAVVWKKTRKVDITTPLPILLDLYRELPIKLEGKTLTRTIYDCACHIIESRYSKKSDYWSEQNNRLAERELFRYFTTGEIVYLIDAGNYAGKAIDTTGTNFIHAISYVMTLDYGYCHGDALHEAMNIKKRKNWKDIVKKASKKYPKFYESTLI